MRAEFYLEVSQLLIFSLLLTQTYAGSLALSMTVWIILITNLRLKSWTRCYTLKAGIFRVPLNYGTWRPNYWNLKMGIWVLLRVCWLLRWNYSVIILKNLDLDMLWVNFSIIWKCKKKSGKSATTYN